MKLTTPPTKKTAVEPSDNRLLSMTQELPRAAVFTSPGKPLELQTFDWPNLAKGEAIVKVDCCTLCGSDLHSLSGRRSPPTPTILGHEIIGRLIEINSPVHDIFDRPLSLGDRVSWSIATQCHDCFFCHQAIPQKCIDGQKYGHLSIHSSLPLSGGLATHCHLAAGTQIVKLPESIPDSVVCPANCATATVAAAIRTAGGCQNKSVAIFGCGLLGLTAAAFARYQKASRVFVTDPDPKRANLALKFGADQSDLSRVPDLTGQRGCDVALEMSGSTDAIRTAIDNLRIGGVLVLVGTVFPTDPIDLDPESVVRRLLRIEGLHNYTPHDLHSAVEFLESSHGQFPFDQLVADEFPLSDVNAAIEFAMNSKPIRIAVRP